MPKTEKQPKPTKSEIRFEDAIERLEEIIDRMESERIPLDELLADYEEGTSLLKLCRGRIDSARDRVETINKSLAQNSPTPANDADDPDADDDDIQLL